MQKTRLFFPKDENLREKSTLFRIYNSLYVIEWDTNQNSENEKGTDLRYLQTVPNQYNIQVQQKNSHKFYFNKMAILSPPILKGFLRRKTQNFAVKSNSENRFTFIQKNSESLKLQYRFPH